MATAAEGTGDFTQYIVIVSYNVYINDQDIQKVSTAFNLYNNKSIFINGTKHKNGKMHLDHYNFAVAHNSENEYTDLRFYEVLKYYDLMGVPQPRQSGKVAFYFKLKPGYRVHDYTAETAVSEPRGTDADSEFSGGSRVRKFPKKTQKNKKYKKSLK